MTDKETLQQIADEQGQSDAVESAHIVTFMGNDHVHLDLVDGDIVIINPDGETFTTR